MHVNDGPNSGSVAGFWILPDLATVEALASELASCAWVWAVALHVAMFVLAMIAVCDALFIPLLAAVEASTIVATTEASITLASTSTEATTKTIILGGAKAITKASTEARHCVQIEVFLNKSLNDCAQRLATS